uniref:Reverse transcriptase Ty1/copia-type domain-containing protein n=1 Tax=Solanum lycopersicum TaxID=4081 RepID=A0A3Q7IUK6_SOLLC
MVFLETNFTFESDNATDQRHTFTTEMFGFDDIVPTTTHIVSSPDSIPAQVMNTPSLNSPLIPSPDSYSPPSNVITAPQPRRSTRGNDIVMIKETKKALQHAFKIKDLGELRYFLGLEFARYEDGLLMHQRKYTLELIADIGLAGAKPVTTPMELNQKLTSVELIGWLLYLTTTRPDISFVVQCLSQFMHCPKSSHMDAALRLVRYLKSAPGLGILMSSTGNWGSCINSRRSITGYLVKFGDSPISWKSKKQSTVSRSSAEAEYRTMASTVAKVVWL